MPENKAAANDICTRCQNQLSNRAFVMCDVIYFAFVYGAWRD